ncbi:MAG TPA: hypothetical protein DIS85_05670 [Vagococcus sp.]|uniref:Uncharacterized protein n=1 Tax=Vagococcus fluvialis bH819 TaxID=1255619 RepID=A0A1X6WM41_9ENTE|nr:hypothetical protein [Vagococcus sp.]SLM85339.1 hypothetical protein FM121_04525 [Vagococcus fluvialis bH819]HCM89367.1 hypothetical protein [Vagococcus sp.]
MASYLWIFILSTIAIISLLIFLISFSKDHFLIKKLKLKKLNYIFNFLLLIISLSDIGLIIYLFSLLKQQIEVFT